MGIVDRILDRILAQAQPGAARPAAAAAATAAAPGQPDQASLQEARRGSVGDDATVLERVDVASVLDQLAVRSPRKLDWRRSMADLMRLCGLEGSLEERRALAAELGYAGGRGHTATMDIWLHKAVLKRLEQNGGRLPAELRS